MANSAEIGECKESKSTMDINERGDDPERLADQLIDVMGSNGEDPATLLDPMSLIYYVLNKKLHKLKQAESYG